MRHHPLLLLLLSLTTIAACAPAPNPQADYEAALKNLERLEARLDNLRPAYDAARQRAAQTVCEEIAGTTPEASAEGAIANLENLLTGATPPTAAANSEKAAPVGDADAALDQLLESHKQLADQATKLTAPIAKARETMRLINTPGTPEAARVEALIADLPEVKAYHRAEKRVARAQATVDAAETQLPGAATSQ
jgi:hypothetical protein